MDDGSRRLRLGAVGADSVRAAGWCGRFFTERVRRHAAVKINQHRCKPGCGRHRGSGEKGIPDIESLIAPM